MEISIKELSPTLMEVTGAVNGTHARVLVMEATGKQTGLVSLFTGQTYKVEVL